MSFWTVEDAGPYKEKSNFLMRTTLLSGFYFYLFPVLISPCFCS